MPNLLYPFLKIYSSIALHFYFRKWQIHGLKNIPEGPVIFVPNHQNAFLDAVLVACSSPKNPWFMTRSDVFKNNFAKKILFKLKMLPVYRFRDGYQTLKNNDAVMNECISKINSGETLLVFSEGSHGEKYQLRPLQKGVARIAFAVNPSKNICIVPVGIQYDFPKTFRSRVLINFGLPIYISDIQKKSSVERESHELLLDQIKLSLQKLILHIDDDLYFDKFQYLKRHRIISEDLVEQLQNDYTTLANFPQTNAVHFHRPGVSLFQNIINKYAKLNLAIPSYIIHKLLLSNIQDPQFGASVKFAAGMILTPAFWIIQAMIFNYITNSFILTLVYFCTLPLALWAEKK